MISKEYKQIIGEYFDITDRLTRKSLLALDEADQNQILYSLTSKLYDHIVNKVDDIDFGNIPDTKGDITKLENYDQLLDCIDVIKDLLLQYKQSTNTIDIVIESINHIENRRDLFTRAFKYNVELPMLIYSTIVLSILGSVSLHIATCIEFIKSANDETFEMVIDRVSLSKTKDSLLLKNLEKFNSSCRKKQLDSSLEYIIKTNVHNLTGTAATIIAGGAIIGLALNIIPILRELVFFFYHSRTQISDYLELQSELIEINAYNLEHSVRKDKDTIVKKQRKIADKLRKISTFLAVNIKKAEKETSKEIANNNKKYKIDDVTEELPDSAASSLF